MLALLAAADTARGSFLERLGDIPAEALGVFAEMAPYLLFGFLVAGLLSVLISPETVERHLGGRGVFLPALKAAILGVPLPLCSCGVIPVAASLRRHGASRGATASFLISTPQTGIDSILATYSILGPVFAVARPIAAFLSGLAGGVAVSYVNEGREERSAPDARPRCDGACCARRTGSWFTRSLGYGFLTLPRDLWKPMLGGLAVAAALGALVPPGLVAEYLGGGSVARDLLAMLVMLVVGLPVYVCATASVPIAAALLHVGVSPGAAFVFVMAGPATNAATIATIARLMGRRTALVYVLAMVASALVAGFAMNWVTVAAGVSHAEHAAHALLPVWAKYAAALVLAGVFAFAALGDVILAGRSPAPGPAAPQDPRRTLLEVRGMTCAHCAEAIKKALEAVSGVERAEVSYRTGTATVWGDKVDEAGLRSAVEELGYEVTEARSATGSQGDGA